MSKAAHTPTPWRVSETSRGSLGQDMRDMEKFYSIMHDVQGNGPDACIAEVEHGSHTFKFNDNYRHEITLDIAKANADLIVKAVNHHQELVTRLYNITNQIELALMEWPDFAIAFAPGSGLLTTYTDARETLKKVIQ